MRLKDRVAVVTGGASGIGKEIARTFARAGAMLVIADLTRAAADSAAAELDGSRGRAIGLAMDVTSESQVDAGMAAAVAAFGRIEILVSNAGIQIVAPLEGFSFADGKRLLRSSENYRSSFARAVGSKRYHPEPFSEGPHPTE